MAGNYRGEVFLGGFDIVGSITKIQILPLPPFCIFEGFLPGLKYADFSLALNMAIFLGLKYGFSVTTFIQSDLLLNSLTTLIQSDLPVTVPRHTCSSISHHHSECKVGTINISRTSIIE